MCRKNGDFADLCLGSRICEREVLELPERKHDLPVVCVAAPQISTGVPAATPERPPQASTGTAGVRIPTTRFSLKETFLTSPDELYRTFTNQEVRRTSLTPTSGPVCAGL